MDIKDTVIRLSEAYGASGREDGAAQLALEMLREYCPDAEYINGNVTGFTGKRREGRPLLVLDAHLDQIGFIVTAVTDDGFVKFSNLGGIDRRLLPAQPVVIHGTRPVSGVICSIPPHLSKGGAGVPEYDDTAIDTGMTGEELRSIVSPGDAVTFDVKCASLAGERLTGGALDDRCGMAAILYALDLLKGCPTKYDVAVIFSAQEELGERGAAIGAYALDADIALAVDVSFATAPGEDPEKCGVLGKGPMIGISPSLSREVTNDLIDTAKTAGIPWQPEVMNGLTSTNADRYSVAREGAKTCTVSIPLRNMHTPAEVIDLTDVELTGRLIAEYIKEA
ncbi:MAG: M20/M25/M40 family metallo-hydrolase [Ruminococcus sp.]|nr:M20/M25/M40 family metallo-hydrolase [Ruminococcus sp.]